MEICTLKAKDFLNPFYLKKPILQEEFNHFVKALQDYKQGLSTNQAQNEKSLVSNCLAPFLNNFKLNALSADKQAGNSEIDLSLNKEQKEVIIEAKKWDSKEFITPQNANAKALREAVLYFLRERALGNNALKFIIITDFYKFYIFKAKSFENFFYKNKIIQSLFKTFLSKDSLLSTTKGFYEELEKILDSKDFETHIFRDKLFSSGGGGK